MDDVIPFTVDVSAGVLHDLHDRLTRTRFPDQLEGSRWSYGTDTSYLRELCAYWREEFDWRAAERVLNRFRQFRTHIDGENLHFIHHRSQDPEAIPLLLLHGWPGSVYEFHKIIRPLADPEGGAQPSFHVICPSLPGFAWSGPTRSPGWDARRMARAFTNLMSRLDYERFVIQGTDWGAVIGTEIAMAATQRVVGLHVNMVLVRPPSDATSNLTLDELDALDTEREWLAQEMGYDEIQSTKPQTLGVALHDSPAGLASWIVEKYRSWSDCDGDVERRFTKDELLTTVTSYWVTNTIGTAPGLVDTRG